MSITTKDQKLYMRMKLAIDKVGAGYKFLLDKDLSTKQQEQKIKIELMPTNTFSEIEEWEEAYLHFIFSLNR